MRCITAFSTAMLALSAPLVSVASDVANLQVAGSISPASCEVSLASGDTVNLGVISAGEFIPGEDKVLPMTGAFVTVDCKASPTRFRLKASDSSGSVASTVGSANYGLGMNGNEPIGYFRLSIAADILPENQYVLKSTDGGAGHAWATPIHGSVAFDHDNETYGFATNATATEPDALMVIALPLSIQPVLAKDVVVKTDVALAGQVTLEVLY